MADRVECKIKGRRPRRDPALSGHETSCDLKVQLETKLNLAGKVHLPQRDGAKVRSRWVRDRARPNRSIEHIERLKTSLHTEALVDVHALVQRHIPLRMDRCAQPAGAERYRPEGVGC